MNEHCRRSVIVHKKDLVFCDILLLFIILRGCCQKHRIYEGSTSEAACGEHQKNRGKEGENNEYAYPNACDPCYLCSFMPMPHPADILVRGEY